MFFEQERNYYKNQNVKKYVLNSVIKYCLESFVFYNN